MPVPERSEAGLLVERDRVVNLRVDLGLCKPLAERIPPLGSDHVLVENMTLPCFGWRPKEGRIETDFTKPP